jgi:hypothetical protein
VTKQLLLEFCVIAAKASLPLSSVLPAGDRTEHSLRLGAEVGFGSQAMLQKEKDTLLSGSQFKGS